MNSFFLLLYLNVIKYTKNENNKKYLFLKKNALQWTKERNQIYSIYYRRINKNGFILSELILKN